MPSGSRAEDPDGTKKDNNVCDTSLFWLIKIFLISITNAACAVQYEVWPVATPSVQLFKIGTKALKAFFPLVEIYNLRPPSSGFVIHVLTQSNPLPPFLKVLFLCPNNQLLNYNDIAKPPKQDQPPQGFHVYSRVFV